MPTDLTPEQIQTVLQGIAIPPQPQILVDLQMEQLSPDCNIKNIAKLISQDVGLSGSILKTVNSPFFNQRNTITSITQAVNLLGVNTVVNLVNGLSIKGALSDDDIIALGRFWDSAMEIANTAAVIAKQLGIPNTDEAYTLGLFHNCGVPLLMLRFKDYLKVVEEAYAEPKLCVTEIENRHLNTNHAVVGYYVGKSWKLPSYLCEAIHEHHNVGQIVETENANARKKTLLAILKMAEHICGSFKVLGNQDVDHEWNRDGKNILLYVGMSEYEYSNLVSQIADIGLGTTDYY